MTLTLQNSDLPGQVLPSAACGAGAGFCPPLQLPRDCTALQILADVETWVQVRIETLLRQNQELESKNSALEMRNALLETSNADLMAQHRGLVMRNHAIEKEVSCLGRDMGVQVS